MLNLSDEGLCEGDATSSQKISEKEWDENPSSKIECFSSIFLLVSLQKKKKPNVFSTETKPTFFLVSAFIEFVGAVLSTGKLS